MSELTIKLPSSGKLKGPEEVTIREMTGADEKILYSGLSEENMDKLISRCIVEPKGLNASDLCESDKYYILMQIRIATFGSNYSYQVKCPDCESKMQVEVDLDDLDVDYAGEDFEKSLECKLPVSNDEIKMKILTTKDIREVNRYLAKTQQTNNKGAIILVRQASIIDTINGEEKTLSERVAYVENASSKDLNYLWKQYGKIRLGINMTTLVDCPNCAHTVSVPVVMNAEFFRPSSDD